MSNTINLYIPRGDILTTIAGVDVFWNGIFMTYLGKMSIDGDGGYRTYHQDDDVALDYLANAGYPGNWWGVATDTGEADGDPVKQKSTDPCPGYYVSPTAYEHSDYAHTDPRRYLDSENVIFSVTPPQLRQLVGPVVLGCRVRMENLDNGKVAWGLVGDVGPKDKLGEASIAAADALGIPSSPKNGGTSDLIILYTLIPGLCPPGYTLKPA
jgi:hypothetical protein